MVRRVRQWVPGISEGSFRFSPDLPDPEIRRLRSLIDDSISRRGGEVAARRRAGEIGQAFLSLNEQGRRRFFELLANEYRLDDDAVDVALADLTTVDKNDRGPQLQALRAALEPRYDLLLTKFLGLEGGLPFLVDLREELLVHRGDDDALRLLDNSLRTLLERWFDVGLLTLERLTWNSPAALLERLIEYEAVHAIESWDDLRGRLGPGRRCYAFLHPGMPDDPLIFVEVALTRGVADALPPLLDHGADRIPEDQVDTAIFYSISNCHRGLTGVSLGDFLIKRVVEELSTELPNLKNFATLSPLPGFRRWIDQQIASESEPDRPGDHTDRERRPLLGPGERHLLSPSDPDGAEFALTDILQSSLPLRGEDLDRVKPVLLQLAARSLQHVNASGRSADPVAHFHFSNGATLDRINWWANPRATGWDRGLGMMVNYRYRLSAIEQNHDRYTVGREVPISDDVRRTSEPLSAPKN